MVDALGLRLHPFYAFGRAIFYLQGVIMTNNENYKELLNCIVESRLVEMIYENNKVSMSIDINPETGDYELVRDTFMTEYATVAWDVLRRVARLCFCDEFDLRAIDTELRIWVEESTIQGDHPDRMRLDGLMRSALSALLCGETKMIDLLITWWEQQIASTKSPLVQSVLVKRREKVRFFLGV